MIDHVKYSTAYLASFTFGGVSLLSALTTASTLLGFVGALLGALGAYFTLRIQYRNWKHPK